VYPVSDAYTRALRTQRAIITTATFKDPFTAVETPLQILSGSSVTVDVTASVRRTLSLSLPPLQSTYDILSVPGGEVTVTQGIRFIDGTIETVPLGVFCIDQNRMTYRPDGQLSLTAPDRWLQVQRNRFGLARSSVASNTGSQEIKRLIEGAWPNGGFPFPGWAASNPSMSATTKVGSLIWDTGDRAGAIEEIAKANSLDFRFNASGLAELQPIPILTQASVPVWVVDAGAAGVMLDGERSRDMTTFGNAVIVSSSASDIILTPVEVKNAHAVPGDPLSTLGPLGYRPRYYSSPLIRTTAQATAAGKTILQQILSVAQQLSLTAVPNAALDGWDVVDVIFPKGDFGTVRPDERHLIESFTVPLTPDGTQSITLRSTRATADDTV
jgi:kumamolisin